MKFGMVAYINLGTSAVTSITLQRIWVAYPLLPFLWRAAELRGQKRSLLSLFIHSSHWLNFTWWGCSGLCLSVWHKPTELAHSFSFCSCVCFCLYGPFNCISLHKFSRQLSAFLLCSSGFISALLVLSTIYLSMKVSLNADIIPCGWLGLKHQLTNWLTVYPYALFFLFLMVFVPVKLGQTLSNCPHKMV